jgi:hypothetical protein
MHEALIKRWIELSQIRAWITDQLPAETDREVRDSLFEAREAIGFAMLHLERVEYQTGGDYSDSENQMQ